VHNPQLKELLFERQRPFSGARHRFVAEKPDWGFLRFSELPNVSAFAVMKKTPFKNL